jgi:membrane protein YqaA with SNARE-associated domain
VGYTLSAGKLAALTAADNSNPLFLIVISSILGGVLGYLMGQLAGLLKARRADTTARSGT